MYRSLLIVWIATFAALAAADREAAEWVIRKGGRVMVNGGRQPVALLAELPAGALRITGVDLTGTVLEPKELEHLAGLEHVRELYLPGSAFTPGAGSTLDGNAELKAIAGMKELERLQFSLHFLPYFNVTDAGFAAISGLTNLRELRCQQCRIDIAESDPGTQARKVLGNRLSDARRGPCDQGALAKQRGFATRAHGRSAHHLHKAGRYYQNRSLDLVA